MKNRKFCDLAQLVQQYAQRGDKNGLAYSLLHPVNVDPDDDEIGRYSEWCLFSSFHDRFSLSLSLSVSLSVCLSLSLSLSLSVLTAIFHVNLA